MIENEFFIKIIIPLIISVAIIYDIAKNIYYKVKGKLDKRETIFLKRQLMILKYKNEFPKIAIIDNEDKKNAKISI